MSSARNPMDTKIMAIQTIFIAILFGLIYLQLSISQADIQNINGVLFLLITNASFSNLFGVLNSFPAEIPIFIRLIVNDLNFVILKTILMLNYFREYQNRMYRVFNYYMSKTLCEVKLFRSIQ